MADLKQKIQNGLDETRILVLGAQVLIGFQFPSVFQKNFDKLPPLTRELMLVGLGLMLVALGLLIWPTAYHRIVAHGEDTKEFHTFITRAAAPALFPFAAGLGIVLFAGGEKLFGRTPGVWLGAVGAATALWFWYGLEMLARRGHPHARVAKESETMSREPDNQQKISERVKQVLTETRVVLPGAQALLGFQFTTMLMEGFDKLPHSAKMVHFAALALVAVSTVLLMTPAAYHRIVEEGEDTEHFHRFTSHALLAAMAFLATGISADFYVVVVKTTQMEWLAAACAGAAIAFFFGLWFGCTLIIRSRKSQRVRAGSPAPAASR